MVNESEFQTFEAVGALLVVLDVDGRVVYWNHACSDLTGYSLEEVRGRRLRDFALIPEDVELVTAAFARLRAGEHLGAFSNYWVTKAGERRWIAWSHTSSTNLDGRIQYIIKTGVDQTEHKRTEDLLEELRTTMAATLDQDETLTCVARLVVKHLADFCILDLIDDGRLRRMKVVHRDPGQAAICETFKLLPVDQRYARVVSGVVESRAPLLMAEVSPQYLESTAQDEEHLRTLRELAPRSLITVPLVARGELLGALVLVSTEPSRRYGKEDLRLAEDVAQRAALAIQNARLHDKARQDANDLREANAHMVSATIRAQEVTEEAEASQRRVEETERELRAVAEFRERFIGIVSHDLRNPLAGINALSEGLFRRGHLDEQDQRSVSRILQSVERMSRIISQLLDLTRARLGGGFPLEPKPTDLRVVCRIVAEELEPAVQLEVEGDVSGAWDPDRLAEALSNIAGNAVEHAARGTPVVVRAYPEGAEVVIEVINQGDPIPAGLLPFIFEPFRRGRQREKSPAGNLGLGLYIAKQIVLSSGGTLDARSAGGTTTFVMRLPRVAPSANPPLLRVEDRP